MKYFNFKNDNKETYVKEKKVTYILGVIWNKKKHNRNVYRNNIWILGNVF